jgi:mono/diheme cytochrome c family protein
MYTTFWEFNLLMNAVAKVLLSGLWVVTAASQSSSSQVEQANKTRAGLGIPDQLLIARGKYIVEGVAVCERCHTPRNADGTPDESNRLMGAPIIMKPTDDVPVWAIRAPRLAGVPPGTDGDVIRLLTTGISRTGRPPKPPMPPFRMTRGDAEAVLAYIKSLPRR